MSSEQEKYDALVVTRSQIAQIYGKTTDTIGTWQGHGMPVLDESRGKARLSYLPDVVQWRESYVQGSDVLSAQAEKARLDKFRANKAELEYHIALGELVDVNMVTKCWSGYIGDCVARLMSLPNKLGPVVFGVKTIPKAVEMIRAELHDCVSELAGLKPTDYIGLDTKVVEIATDIESKRVGRPKQKVKPGVKRGAGKVANK